MADIVSSFVVVDGIISATLLRDGSLVLATRNDGENGQVTYREEMTLSSEGVKTLVSCISRVAELRDGAVQPQHDLGRTSRLIQMVNSLIILWKGIHSGK